MAGRQLTRNVLRYSTLHKNPTDLAKGVVF